MKRVFNWGGLLAAALATVFTGCTKENISEPSGAEQNKIIISANALTPASVDSKTVVGDRTDAGTYPVYWSETGEAIDVIEVVDNWAPEAKDFIQSSAYTLSDDKKNATFEITLTENTTGTAFDYYACYPSSVCTGIYTNYKDAAIKFPSAQTPTATSVDPAASILFASDTGYDAQPSSLNFQFKHVAAYAKMTISNLPVADDEVIQSVTFSAPDNNLAGTYWYYYEEPEKSEIPSTGTKLTAITANMEGVVAAGAKDFTVWFACLPATVSTKFQVSVATDKQLLIRDVEISGNDLAFVAGQISAFTVDMSSSAQGSDFSGEYVVLAAQDGIYYALAGTNVNSTTRLDAVTFDYNGTDENISTTNPDIVWTVKQSGSSYTFANGGKYLSWSSGNYAEMSDSEYLLSIRDNQNGTYAISSTEETTRILAKNESNEYFAFYAGTQIKDLLLIPAELLSLPTVIFEEPSISLEYNDEEVHETVVTVNDATSVVVGAYNDAEGSIECDWLMASYENGKISYFATPNETNSSRAAYIVVKATNGNGTSTSSIYVMQSSATVSTDNETLSLLNWEFDGASTWDSNYIIRTVNFTSATIKFTSANKQTSNITDCPVTKGQPVELIMKDGKALISVTVNLKQWTTKAQTASLYTSVDGGSSYSSEPVATSSDFLLSVTGLPSGTNAVKVEFSSQSNQVGIESFEITYNN